MLENKVGELVWFSGCYDAPKLGSQHDLKRFEYLHMTREEWYQSKTSHLREGDDNEHYWHYQALEHQEYEKNLVFADQWDGPYFVVGILYEQCYGGPEEGGWYYTRPSITRWSAVSDRDYADHICKTLNAKEKPRDGDFGALGGDDTVSSTYPEGFIPSGWTASSKVRYEVRPWPLLPEFERPYYE